MLGTKRYKKNEKKKNSCILSPKLNRYTWVSMSIYIYLKEKSVLLLSPSEKAILLINCVNLIFYMYCLPVLILSDSIPNFTYIYIYVYIYIYIHTQYIYIYTQYRLELPKLCYHPGWRLMRLGYRTCFHTLYDEKIYIYIYNENNSYIAKSEST